jgi:hypothetical protein
MLKQEQAGYDFYQKQIVECDEHLYRYLQEKPDRSAGATLPEEKRRGRREKKKKNKPQHSLPMSMPAASG